MPNFVKILCILILGIFTFDIRAKEVSSPNEENSGKGKIIEREGELVAFRWLHGKYQGEGIIKCHQLLLFMGKPSQEVFLVSYSYDVKGFFCEVTPGFPTDVENVGLPSYLYLRRVADCDQKICLDCTTNYTTDQGCFEMNQWSFVGNENFNDLSRDVIPCYEFSGRKWR
jgi:hypothetical protein